MALDDKNNQRIQGGAGYAGTSTGDSSGTGVNKINPIPGKGLATKFKRGALTSEDVKAVAVPVGEAIKGTAGEIGSRLEQKGVVRTLGQGVIDLAKSYGEGATKFNERVKGILPAPSSIGKYIVGSDISNRSIPTPTTSVTPTPTTSVTPTPTTSVTPTPTTSVTPTPIVPTSSSSTSTPDSSKLGTFTTPTGGIATVTRPVGKAAFTPAQQSFLQSTLNREADPAFQARLAEQAAIVDARREQTRLGDIRRAGEDQVATQAGLIAERKRLAGGNVGAQIAGIDRQLGEIGDIGQANIAAKSAERRQVASDLSSQQTELGKLTDKTTQEDIKNKQEFAKLLTGPELSMASPREQLAIYHQMTNQPANIDTLRQIHGKAPGFEEALSNKQSLYNFIVDLGYPDQDISNILSSSGL